MTASLGGYSWSGNSTFTNPSFGIDSSGAFSSMGSALSSNPLGSSGGSMLPALAGPIIGAVGAIGGGIASGKGAQSAASQARAAAEAQARQVTEANRENMYGGFGFEKAGKEYNFLYGGDIDRFGAFRDAKLESALQQGPAAQAANRIQMAQNLALRQQELFGSKPGGAPMTRFV